MAEVLRHLALVSKVGAHPLAPARRAHDQPSPAAVATPALVPPAAAAPGPSPRAGAGGGGAATRAAQVEAGIRDALLCRVKEVLSEVLAGVPPAFRELLRPGA